MLYLYIFIAAYILIGIFIGTLVERITEDFEGNGFLMGMFLWPILIIVLIILCICAVPYKLANWIIDAFERRKNVQ